MRGRDAVELQHIATARAFNRFAYQFAMLAEDFGQSTLNIGLLLTKAAKKNKQKRLHKFVTPHTHTHTHTHKPSVHLCVCMCLCVCVFVREMSQETSKEEILTFVISSYVFLRDRSVIPLLRFVVLKSSFMNLHNMYLFLAVCNTD